MDPMLVLISADQDKYREMIEAHVRMVDDLPPFTNEMNTMVHMFTHRSFPQRLHDVQRWYSRLPPVKTDTLEMTRQLRTKGNEAFNRTDRTDRDVMAAARFYTLAISMAPPSGLELAMAHANRAIALQTAGYYEAAYDDGVCAREAGYPAKTVGKVILRQAYCAARLGSLPLLQWHMAEISQDDRAKNKKDFELLKERLRVLKRRGGGGDHGDGDGDNGGLGPAKLLPIEPKTTVANAASPTDRYLTTNGAVQKHELMFMDRAVAMAPYGHMKMCGNCGVVVHVPFPCNRCGGEEHYCSVKCRAEHRRIHQYECTATGKGVFCIVDRRFHLAMRILIAELPQLLQLLRGVGSERELWAEVSGRGHIIAPDSALGRSLLATTSFRELPSDKVLTHAIVAQVMMYVLQTDLEVHTLFNTYNVPIRDWELVLASLCMRRLNQVTLHAQYIETLHCGVLSHQNGVHNLLVPDVWASPKRLAKGNCHLISSSLKALAFFPYINNCRRTCQADVLLHKYRGHQSWTYANRDYQSGEEVKRFHHFAMCPDFQCPGKNQAEQFELIHKTRHQRCEYTECGQKFLAMRWSQPPLPYDTEPFTCPKCRKPQPKMLLELLMAKMSAYRPGADLHQLFQLFRDMDNIYLGMHCVKPVYAQRIVYYCLEVQRCYHSLSAEVLQKVLELALFNKRWQETFEPESSLSYTASLMPLFDLIALGQYKPSRPEMDKMLQLGLLTVSDEFKDMIMHYYNDYVKEKIDEE